MEDVDVLALRIPVRHELANPAYFAQRGRREQMLVDHVAYLGRERLEARGLFLWCSHDCGQIRFALAQQDQGKWLAVRILLRCRGLVNMIPQIHCVSRR